MHDTIVRLGIVPFFENIIPGYSIEELTPPQFWFNDEDGQLGPWDWKIDCVQSGDIVYGKFLLGGKAAFATPRWYRELRNYRMGMTPQNRRHSPALEQDMQKIMDFVKANGSITIKQTRQLLGIKKSAADALIARLQNRCMLVTGDLERIYRGQDLHYNGWQTASFCSPEDLYEEDMAADSSAEESLSKLLGHIAGISGENSEKKLLKLLG